MRPLVALALTLLAACASPDRAYWGVDPVRVTIDGRDYSVHVRRDPPRPRVQVIRLGYARRAEHPAILLAMQRAAEQASGCTLTPGSISGDSGVMNARLSCAN